MMVIYLHPETTMKRKRKRESRGEIEGVQRKSQKIDKVRVKTKQVCVSVCTRPEEIGVDRWVRRHSTFPQETNLILA